MNKDQTQDLDVIIVGSGMTGLAMALSLADTHLRIGILEQASQLPEFDAKNYSHRVSALNASSKNLLNRLNAWQAMEAMRISPYYAMQVWDGQSIGKINFTASEMNLDNLGYIVENNVTVLGLLSQIEKHSNIEIFKGVTLNSMQVLTGGKRVLTLTKQDSSQEISLTASLVIGCDGANSFVRSNSNIELETWDYGHTGIVATVKTQKNHAQTARQRFGKDLILAFLPLKEPNLSSIVFSLPHATAQEVADMTDVDFCDYLGKAFEFKLGTIESATPRHAFKFMQRNAKNYVETGLALVGDSAHTIHPLAGQGVNQGFLDVLVLAEELLKAVANGENIGDIRILKTYERRRRADNLLMMAGMQAFKIGFTQSSPRLNWLRNKALNLTDSTNIVKKILVAQANGEARISNTILKKISAIF